MNHYLLHVTLNGGQETLPWQADLSSRRIVVLRALNLRQAVQYCRVYRMMLILLELDGTEAGVPEALAELAATAPEEAAPAPIVGLVGAALDGLRRAKLAAAGLAGLIAKDDPPRFILWQLELLAALGDLRRFEQSRMDVGSLAHRTRTHLHDLSQPLSAVQGRLQLMAAKCPGDDPNAQTFQELVRLIFEVSHQVMEIHQIHRQYS